MGIFGYSRGAMAASLMLPRLKDVKAAILGGGICVFKKGLRRNNHQRNQGKYEERNRSDRQGV